MTKQLQAARNMVRQFQFGTTEWEAAMQVVRTLVNAENARRPAEEFCSVDSGEHRTRLLTGRIV